MATTTFPIDEPRQTCPFCRHVHPHGPCTEWQCRCKQQPPEATMTPDELRDARIALGLTQQQLAEKLGVATLTIRNWERGVHRIPHMATIALAALAERQS